MSTWTHVLAAVITVELEGAEPIVWNYRDEDDT